MSATHGVMSVTSYYGPSDERCLVASDLSEADARERAAAHDPDYDESVQCRRLGHNQSGATIGVPVEILTVIDPTALPDLIDDATESRAAEIVRARYDDPDEAQRALDGRDGGEAWYSAVEAAIAERGEYVVAEYLERDMGDGETMLESTGDWYWVRQLPAGGDA